MDYYYVLISVVTKFLSSLIPKKQNLWVFASWFGNDISDNPKAISEFLLKNHPELELVWIVRNPDAFKNVPYRVVKRNSIKGVLYVMRSRVAVFNQGYVDFCTFNILGGVYTVQLWHGIAWKKIGDDGRKEVNTRKERRYLNAFHKVTNYNLYISPSDKYTNIIKSAFKANPSKIIKAGQPRNEILFNHKKCDELKKSLIDSLNFNTSKPRIIVYMPTFRDNKQNVESLLSRDFLEKIIPLAEKYNFIIIEKSHYSDQKNKHECPPNEQRIFLAKNWDAQILLASADILITDYSSCFFDYVIRNKPVIHYVYDYEYYKSKDRGIYYEISEVAAGSIVFNREQLISAIIRYLEAPSLDESIRIRIRKEFVTYESPGSSQVIVNKILEDILQEYDENINSKI